MKGPAYKLVEAYSPNTKQWTQKKDMNHPRHGTQAIVSGNGIYIAAGSPNRGGGRQLNMEVYNEDSADGTPIITSNLETPKLVSIKQGDTKNFIIKNTNGNSASFINSVKLTGSEANSFKIKTNFNLTLLNANSELNMEISHLGKNSNETAFLQIIYNNNIEKNIKLISN